MGKRDFAPAGVELNKEGLPLLGARLDDLANGYEAALVSGRRKHRISSFRVRRGRQPYRSNDVDGPQWLQHA